MSLINGAKFLVQRTLRQYGWEIHRFVQAEASQLCMQLERRKISSVLDVGANEGQFASALLSAGYAGRIISFEPLPEPYKKLKKMAEGYPNWDAAPRGAVGAQDGSIDINVSQNVVSSSILDILPGHTSAAPASKFVGKEMVPILTLDTYLKSNPIFAPFIKIDTQGYEMEVLKGAPTLLGHASGLQVELSTAPLYEGQPDLMEMFAFIKRAGFTLWSINPGFRDPKTSRLLQVDALFFRE
jgi:FkbM family methyltransferase